MTNRLFVYGTLAPSRPNAHILQNIGGSWEEASVKGKLFQEGWGASMGYPAIIPDESGEKVEGFLFTSKNLKTNWSELDAFEGEGYERVITKVKLKSGEKIDAYIYSLKSSSLI
jgi:gamma-glutamylcyclotransferase (GGCT)/AIG2-like uncharacterized protein YtfP